MYRVLIERAAEKVLSRLLSEGHDRVVADIKCSRTIPARPVAEHSVAANATGASVWVTTEWFTKLLTRLASCVSTACATEERILPTQVHA
jgi:hypothetical protein